jgi:phosphatidylserine/phosphatidylglycerophosphate/cardiolipin synthase-like enzyme
MSLQIRAYSNCNDAFIVWRSDALIPDCVGFELRRIENGNETILNNRVSFSSGEPDPQHPESSATSPLRRFTWTDHGLPDKSVVAYKVIPVVAPGTAAQAPQVNLASPASNTVTITGDVGNGFECYFNRGMILSQFMAHYLKGDFSNAALNKFKAALNADPDKENNIRTFLGGPLRGQLVQLLETAKSTGGQVFMSVFELSDNLLIERLTQLGKNAHIILSNGAHKSASDDENSAARATLKPVCDVSDRMLPSGYLAHNKFAVFTDSNTKPLKVITGSTNWSPTGLCTQMNNGIVFDDTAIAQIFLDQWHRIQQEKSLPTPPALKTLNDKLKPVPAKDVDVWFTPTTGAPEMDAVTDLVAKAEEGVLFLMFQPGGSPIENSILQLKNDKPNLFVKGVISTMDQKDETKASVTLVGRNGKPVPPLTVVQPAGISSVGDWAAEVSRKQFLTSIGFAIVHSKAVVIDPNGDNPVVITGSHNFSETASTKNDENLVIIQNNPALALAYAVNIQSVYDSYEFRAVAALMQSEGKNVIDFMKDPKSWQAPWFQGDKLEELDFWLPGGTVPATPSSNKPQKAPPKQVPAKKAPAKSAPKKKPAKKAAAKKSSAKAAKKKSAGKSGAQRPAKKKKAAAKKAAAKKSPAKKTTLKKNAPKKTFAKKKAVKPVSAKKTTPRNKTKKKAAQKKTAGRKPSKR